MFEQLKKERSLTQRDPNKTTFCFCMNEVFLVILGHKNNELPGELNTSNVLVTLFSLWANGANA